MELSEYQETILEQNNNSGNDLLVDAKPGSGKTTTIVELINNSDNPTDILAIAFTKTIARQLEDRIPLAMCTNSHSFGMSLLKSGSHLAKNKYWEYCKQQGKPLIYNASVSSVFGLVKLLDIIRLADTSIFCDDETAIQNIKNVVYDYSVNGVRYVDNKTLKFVREGIDWGINWYKRTGQVDFADMLYLPVELNLRPKEPFNRVVVDEMQDLSNIQLSLIDLAVDDLGKLIMVGDENQSCFKFAGAGINTIKTLKDRYSPDILPLPICYRCPTSHIDIANDVYPGILARSGAPEGNIIEDITQSQVISHATPGDLIICRRVAPLITLCLEFIIKGIPAAVHGKGLKENLFKTFDDISKQQGFSYKNVFSYIQRWYEKTKKYYKDEFEFSDSVIKDLGELNDQVVTCVDGFPDCESFTELKNRIEIIFTQQKDSILLMSIHSAKGTENQTVFLLECDHLPFQFPGMTQDDRVQEKNLLYIALTRSKETLYLIPKDED